MRDIFSLLADAIRSDGVAAPLAMMNYWRTRRALQAHQQRVIGPRDMDRLEALRARRPPATPMSTIDIVVPVHNHAEGLATLLGDLGEAGWETAGMTVVVDDASGDPRCAELIARFVGEGPRRSTFRLDRQRGYSGAVNAGLRSTSGDIIVLTTDIRVTGSQLRRLGAHLHRYPLTATVTPMTNNGFLASLPDQTHGVAALCDDGWRELDDLAAEQFAGLSEPIPVGTGFCLAIRRDALALTGGLPDTGVGYGEDTQLSFMASRFGMENRLALDCFVPHEGGASYGSSRGSLVRRQSFRVLRAFPEFRDEVARYLDESAAPLVHLKLLHDLAAASSAVEVVPPPPHRVGRSIGFRFPTTGETFTYAVDPAVAQQLLGTAAPAAGPS